MSKTITVKQLKDAVEKALQLDENDKHLKHLNVIINCPNIELLTDFSLKGNLLKDVTDETIIDLESAAIIKLVYSPEELSSPSSEKDIYIASLIVRFEAYDKNKDYLMGTTLRNRKGATLLPIHLQLEA